MEDLQIQIDELKNQILLLSANQNQGQFSDLTVFSKKVKFNSTVEFSDNILPDISTCRVYRSATTFFVDGTPSSIDWNNESFDTNTIHESVDNPTRLTCKRAGYYIISAGIKLDTASRLFTTALKLNGTTEIAWSGGVGSATASTSSASLQTVYNLAVGDYVEVFVTAIGGDAFLDLSDSHFEMIKIR